MDCSFCLLSKLLLLATGTMLGLNMNSSQSNVAMKKLYAYAEASVGSHAFKSLTIYFVARVPHVMDKVTLLIVNTYTLLIC